MSFKLCFVCIKHQAEFTDVQSVTMIFFRKRSEVPGFNHVLSDVNELDSFNFSAFKKLLDCFIVHAFVFIVEEKVFVLLFG